MRLTSARGGRVAGEILIRSPRAGAPPAAASLLVILLAIGCATDGERTAFGQSAISSCSGVFTTYPDGRQECDGEARIVQGGALSEVFGGIWRVTVGGVIDAGLWLLGRPPVPEPARAVAPTCEPAP